MPRPAHNPGSWPRLMRAATAAAYVDEVNAEAFLRRVGTGPDKVYPAGRKISGRGRVWAREDLDEAIDRIAGTGRGVSSLAGDL